MKRLPLWTAAITLAGCLTAAYACKSSSNGAADSATKEAVSTPAGKNGFQCNTQAKSDQDPPGIGYAATCTDLITKFPQIDDPNNPEDTRVLCPFLRILNRSEQMVQEIAANLRAPATKAMQLPVSIKGLVGVATQFGCGGVACGGVATQVSAGQSGKAIASVTPADIVDIGNLASSKGVAHDCGFTFAYGETVVTPATRTATLALFKAKAVNGRLTFGDVMQMKKDMCKRDFALSNNGTLPLKNTISASGDTLDPAAADITEVNLIFTYLGGVDNGYILYTDLERFLHAQMPANKTKYLVDVPLFAHLKQILTGG